VIPTALTIAGSDPSGGAGIQADLKTFSALKVYGMSVIAALTVQNSRSVFAVSEVTPKLVGEQIDAVASDIPPKAVKTGMLMTAENVEVVAAKVRQYQLRNLVVDPVTVATSGTPLLNADAIDKLRRDLLPAALIVTPNLDEARVLTGQEVRTVEDMEEAALRIHGFGAQNIYIKGGHLEGDAVDVFFDGDTFTRLSQQRIANQDSHGTGCVLSAAMAAYLARGEPVIAAVQYAKEFVTAAIRNGLRLGEGNGPCDPIGIR
jgi:hydroxymethylpyrimidine/phosphomethylpyrimidine kinase